jgi:NADH dehydrogenase FAD-containing subunit
MHSGVKRAVVVGAGHAHLYTLKRANEFVQRGYQLVLIAPGPFWYSGLATGMLGGAYPAALDQVDVASLVTRGGGQFIEDEMSGLDLPSRVVLLNRGAPVSFDVLSLNIGSVCPPIPGEDGVGYSVKPIPRLWDLRRELERHFKEEPGRALRVAIGGGGATGIELAANIVALAELQSGKVDVTVYVRGDRPVRPLSVAARASLLRFLTERGVKLRLNAQIERVADGRLLLANGLYAAFDLFLNATGLQPPDILKSTGLPLSSDGALIVDRFLRSPGAPSIFGGGDCIALEGHPLPKIGVFAIREAPVIFHNLLAALADTPLRSFEPQREFLSIMALGAGQGFAVRGSLWWRGRAAFWLKDRIDRKFMREFQDAAGQEFVAV